MSQAISVAFYVIAFTEAFKFGIRHELVKHNKEKQFEGYDQIGTCLFVHSKNSVQID